jgi:hypothetical protein
LGAGDVLGAVVNEGGVSGVEVVEATQVGERCGMGFAQAQFVAEVDGLEVGGEEVPVTGWAELRQEGLCVESVCVAEQEKAVGLSQFRQEGGGPRLQTEEDAVPSRLYRVEGRARGTVGLKGEEEVRGGKVARFEGVHERGLGGFVVECREVCSAEGCEGPNGRIVIDGV